MQALAMSAALPDREYYFKALSTCSDGSLNIVWFAQIIASWQVGEGVLPAKLGLSLEQFERLLKQCFPGYVIDPATQYDKSLDFSRMLEKQDLEQLLRQFASVANEETECLISIIVAACLGSDHLWQDLGLWSRKELSALIRHNFPELALRNHKDMKWKKFLYKQLCEAEGLYVCRAPSCEVCQDYQHCFGPEE